MKRKWRSVGRGLLRLGGVGLLALLGAGVYVYDYPRVAADLPEAALAYRQAGLPWTAKDIAPSPPVLPEENAAPLIRAAMAAWPQKTSRSGGESTIVYESPLWDALMYGEPVAPLLQRFASALALVHKAAAKPRLDFGRDWDLTPTDYEDQSWMKMAAKMLAARAKVRTQAGDDGGALDDLRDARRLGILIASEPGLSPVFSGTACEAVSMTGARDCLAVVADQPARLDRYRNWLAEPAPHLRLPTRGTRRGVHDRLSRSQH